MQQISFTAEELPKKLDEARQFLKEGKNLEQAEAIFNAVLNKDKTCSAMIAGLGHIAASRNCVSLSEILYEVALNNCKNDKDRAEIHNNLGVVYKTQRFDTERACQEFEKSLKLEPNDSQALVNYASIYVGNGTPKKALDLLNKALLKEKDDIAGHWNRALALLEMGDYKKGFEEYDHGFRTDSRAHKDYGLPNWDGSPDKTIIVYGEQGIGDEIMFASMLPELAARSKLVIFDAHPRLADIFRRSFPQMPVYGTRKCKPVQWPANHPGIDAQTSIASIARYLRQSESAFPRKPYLLADPLLQSKLFHKLDALGNKPKIGISWKGGTPGTGLAHRTMKLEQFLPLFKAIDVDWISLQYTDDAPKKIAEFESKHPYKIHHWQDIIDDYDETAALVSSLDLVISVPQSVVHLAGALGTSTFQLCPKKSMWQAGVYQKDMPWYGCVKNFWQDDSEKWDVVINHVKEELCRLYPTNTAR